VEPFTRLESHAVLLPLDNVDTDQIIPARFMKVIDKHGLAEHLFHDWRYRPDGTPEPGFALNRPEASGAQILVAGANFGAGSSREHAVWALAGRGLRALVATSFADIFYGNALKNGLLPVRVAADFHGALWQLIAADPRAQLLIDLSAQTLRLPDGRSASFPIDAFSKRCLLGGLDQLEYLLSFAGKIAAHEAAREPSGAGAAGRVEGGT
jgi:3-isopropylmalate/(R)-2-methylmalate dehydratase small subunit